MHFIENDIAVGRCQVRKLPPSKFGGMIFAKFGCTVLISTVL